MKATKLSPGEFPLGRNLSVLAKLYLGALTKRMEQIDIDKHFSLLMIIESKPQGCTQQFLCDELQADKASMVRFIDYLSKKGLVQRTQCMADRREHHIALTDKGRSTLQEIHTGVSEMNKTAFKGISAAKQKEFHEMMCIIRENLENEPSYRVIVNYKKVKSVK